MGLWKPIKVELGLKGPPSQNTKTEIVERRWVRHTVKKLSDFPVPRRDVTNQTLPGREWLFNYHLLYTKVPIMPMPKWIRLNAYYNKHFMTNYCRLYYTVRLYIKKKISIFHTSLTNLCVQVFSHLLFELHAHCTNLFDVAFHLSWSLLNGTENIDSFEENLLHLNMYCILCNGWEHYVPYRCL